MSICFIGYWFRRILLIPELGVFYKEVGILVVGVFGGYLFYRGSLFYSSVPQSYFDIFSYHILFSSLFSFPSVPQSNFDEISYYILFFSPSVLF